MLEHGIILVLIKWFMHWQEDLDAFRIIRQKNRNLQIDFSPTLLTPNDARVEGS